MSTIHQRAALDDGIASLQTELRQLASLVDLAIERGVAALERLDQDMAAQVIAEDRAINALRYRIEDRAIHLIATQQPIAGDLRLVVAALMVVSELERMGDYAAGIARVVQLHEGMTLLKPLVDVPVMSRTVRAMLRDAVDAFIRRDAEAARRVSARDDDVDALYRAVYEELVGYMERDVKNVERATWLIWVAHNLERVGDRIQNICERTVYEVTGTMHETGRVPGA